MKKSLAITIALASTLSLTGCAQSGEAVCKNYIKEFGTYLADVMQSDSEAESKFAAKLNGMAATAPADIATALRADAADVANSYETATVCKQYTEG